MQATDRMVFLGILAYSNSTKKKIEESQELYFLFKLQPRFWGSVRAQHCLLILASVNLANSFVPLIRMLFV